MATVFKGSENFVIEDGKIVGLQSHARESLIDRIIKIFEHCDESYPDCSRQAVGKIVDEWFNSKKGLLNLFVKSPYYNGNYAIEFDKDIKRTFDTEVYKDFIGTVIWWAEYFSLTEVTFANRTYQDIKNIVYSLEQKMYVINNFKATFGYGGMNEELTVREDLDRFYKIKQNILDNYRISNSKAYDIEEYQTYKLAVDCLDLLRTKPHQFIDKQTEEFINSHFPKFKAKEGQKTSRVVNKLCKMLRLDRITNGILLEKGMGYGGEPVEKNMYNYKFAMFADACNPFEMQKHIFVSLNPEDYLLMSFGTNWYSCHDIINAGCYSSGTLSYLEDGSSVVFFIIPDNAYEKMKDNGDVAPRKEMRQMFHIGEGKFIQARLYPYDQTDYGHSVEPEDYVQYREIMQSLLAELWGVPNLWTNKRGRSACSHEVDTYGTHYTDYTHYDNCNVSYLKDYKETERIKIGKSPICPSCGYAHSETENCFCGDCTSDGTYCEYHDRYEHEEMTDVRGYGWVCEEALEECEYFHQCEECGDWFDTRSYSYSDAVYSYRDDHWFCDANCAERYGYYWNEVVNDYIYEDDFEYSEIDEVDLPNYDLDEYDLCYAVYNKDGDKTIAYQDSCYYIDGEWYDSNICVEIDGEYVPEWKTKVDDETGEVRRIA